MIQDTGVKAMKKLAIHIHDEESDVFTNLIGS
jgi:hypothetical protein